jgi:hypothetical protein
MNICGKNRHLRQAQKRYAAIKKTILLNKNIDNKTHDNFKHY